MTTLLINNVGKQYGNLETVRGVSLKIRQGSALRCLAIMVPVKPH